MKMILSFIVQFAPFLILSSYISKEEWEKEKLKWTGLGLIFSAVSGYLGALFFGLSILSKFHISDGDKALGICGIIFVFGLILVLAHYIGVLRKSI
jgi:O-antigen/teichoic acid export membrane protein